MTRRDSGKARGWPRFTLSHDADEQEEHAVNIRTPFLSALVAATLVFTACSSENAWRSRTQ